MAVIDLVSDLTLMEEAFNSYSYEKCLKLNQVIMARRN